MSVFDLCYSISILQAHSRIHTPLHTQVVEERAFCIHGREGACAKQAMEAFPAEDSTQQDVPRDHCECWVGSAD